MVLPTKTIIGTGYVRPGVPAAGKKLTIQSLESRVDANNRTLVTDEEITVLLDDQGQFSVDLVPSDADGLTPSPVAYEIREFWGKVFRTYQVLVPAAGSDPIDLFVDLAPIGDPPDPPSAYALVTALADETAAREASDAAIDGLTDALTTERDERTDADTALAAGVATINDTLALKADLIDGKIPTIQLPPSAFENVYAVADIPALLALPVPAGQGAVVTVAADVDGNPALYLLPSGADPAVESSWVATAYDAAGLAAAAQTAAEGYAAGLTNDEAIARAQAIAAAIAAAQAAAPATIKESAGPHGHVYTLGWQVSGDEGVSGLRGLILSRDVAEYPVGVTLRSDDAGGPVWDTIAIDATTTNLVLAYSHLKASGSSDMIRGDIESHWTISDTAGVPDNTVRLNLESTAGDNATTATLLKLSVASGSPINAAGKYLIKADVAGVRVLDVTKDGYAAFGFAYSGTLAGGALETKNGAVIRATDTNPTLWLARRGTVTADWVLRVVSTGSGQLELLDNASGRRPLIFRTTAPDATIYADTAGLVLSPTGGKVGFMGATPVARRATTADATDLASVITLANALKADLVALGLKS